MICTTLLNPSFDLIYTTPTPNQSTYLDLPTRLFPAGKGVNCAKVIASLGEEVSLFSIMPEEDDDRFTNYLEKLNIVHHSCKTPGSVRINTTILNSRHNLQFTTTVKVINSLRKSKIIFSHLLIFISLRMTFGFFQAVYQRESKKRSMKH